jgi:predicted Zn finger-like uncharacterized protein
MYTRCPECGTVHPVNAALLAQAGGRYRCGKCKQDANALEFLFDEWPEADQHPVEQGDLPVLGLTIDLDEARQARLDPEAEPSSPGGDDDPGRESGANVLLRISWIAGAVIVLSVVAFGLSDFLGQPLVNTAPIETTLVDLGIAEAEPSIPFRDLERIHLVSRELRSLSGQPGTLRLTATIVNRAPKSQPFPSIEVRLLNSKGLTLNSHFFEPQDYLAQGSMRGAGMAPQAYLPLTLDLDDPGEKAVGFELTFH